jgi:hypothetical protein
MTAVPAARTATTSDEAATPAVDRILMCVKLV